MRKSYTVLSASKTALIAETPRFAVIDASSNIVLLKNMLMMSAPACIALRTACRKLLRLRLMLRFCAFAGQARYAAVMPASSHSPSNRFENAVLARLDAGSTRTVSHCRRFMVQAIQHCLESFYGESCSIKSMTCAMRS